MKSYRPYAPNQPYLLPPLPSEWLPDGHLAYFILDLLEDIDLGDIERVLQAKDHRGERPFSPRTMTALWLYGYAVGVISSRKLEKATYEDVAFRVLAAGEQPHFTSLNEFREVPVCHFLCATDLGRDRSVEDRSLASQPDSSERRIVVASWSRSRRAPRCCRSPRPGDHAVAVLALFAATRRSRHRGHWCSSPRLVVTTYVRRDQQSSSALAPTRRDCETATTGRLRCGRRST